MYLIRFRTLYLFILVLTYYSCDAKSKLIQLDEDNWDAMIQGEWMVEFFAPWCPACRALNPIWKEFATWSTDLGISVGQVDVSAAPELSGRFMVTALPTIFHVKDGAFRQYRGAREKDDFMTFIEEKKWEKIDEISSWKNPSSLQMSVVAKLFKLSMILRSVHSTLTEEYGFPCWASYIFYAIITIVVGALLGLILVCIIDFIFPPSPPGHVAQGKKSDEEDLKDDDPKSEEEKSAEISEEEKSAEISEEEKSAEISEEDNSAEKSFDNSEPEERPSDSGSPSVRKRKSRKAD